MMELTYIKQYQALDFGRQLDLDIRSQPQLTKTTQKLINTGSMLTEGNSYYYGKKGYLTRVLDRLNVQNQRPLKAINRSHEDLKDFIYHNDHNYYLGVADSHDQLLQEFNYMLEKLITRF